MKISPMIVFFVELYCCLSGRCKNPNFNWEDDIEKYSEPIISYDKMLKLLRMNRSTRNYKQKKVPS
ncbi:MAG: hypothetical protein ACFFG0_06995 [Candidatus Thorarchaeota archaeon]